MSESTPKFQRLNDGRETHSDDPKRGIWYAAVGVCGYWTDDWSKLAASGGIPCCPTCGCVGMQSTAAQWFGGAKQFEASNPRYSEWLSLVKEQCGKSGGIPFLSRYKTWIETEGPVSP